MLLQYSFYTIQLSTLVLSLSIPPLKVVHPAVKAKNSETKPVFNIIPKYNTANEVVKESTKNVTKPIKQSINSKPMSAKLSPLKPVTNSVTPKSNTTTTTSNKSNKVFRMLGQPVQGYQLSNGTFSHVAYSKAMKSLATRQKYTQSQVATSKSKQLKRQTNGSVTNGSVVVFGSDLVNYPTPLLTTFGIGTPPQQIPFFLNMESSTTVVFSKNSTCSAGGGYDIDASSSVKEIAQYKGGDILLESPSESIDEIAIQGTYMSEQVTFSYKDFSRAALATLVYAETLYLSRQCIGQVGLAAYRTYSTDMDELVNFIYTLVGGFTSVVSLYIGATEPQQFPITFEVEIMIGARDQSEFTVNGLRFGTSVGTVTFSLLHLGIHLSPYMVKAIYGMVGESETYQPEGGPVVYTYPCRLNPEVSFTIPGTKIVLDINPDDFNMGFSPHDPTFCIGAIQLPNSSDGPVHTLGLVFMRSWYTVYKSNYDGTANSIGLARAVRN